MLKLTMKRGPDTLSPRSRHTSVSDGMRFIYAIGSQFTAATTSVEKFDMETNAWSALPNLIKGGMNLSCCYFRSGLQEESLWCLNSGSMIQRLKLSQSGSGEVWT
jgi:hypothetical protein